jgi:hypothetical protein
MMGDDSSGSNISWSDGGKRRSSDSSSGSSSGSSSKSGSSSNNSDSSDGSDSDSVKDVKATTKNSIPRVLRFGRGKRCNLVKNKEFSTRESSGVLFNIVFCNGMIAFHIV